MESELLVAGINTFQNKVLVCASPGYIGLKRCVLNVTHVLF